MLGTINIHHKRMLKTEVLTFEPIIANVLLLHSANNTFNNETREGESKRIRS